MSTLIEARQTHIAESTSRVTFTTTGGTYYPVWDRFLSIDGQPAFEIGNVCNTCNFFFERKAGAPADLDVGTLADRLEVGVRALSADLVDSVRLMMPAGDYQVLLVTCLPAAAHPGQAGDYFHEEQRESWGDDLDLIHDPRSDYYRLGSRRISVDKQLFEFLIPLTLRDSLNPERVDHYVGLLESGDRPTAVAVSVLDVKGPYHSGIEHWCLAHYLLDGHHKVEAAARIGKPITLLSFVNIGNGVSSMQDVGKLVSLLKA